MISKSQFDLLFNSNKCLVFYLEKLGEDYKFIYANKQSKNVLIEDIEGKSISDILPKSRYEKFIKYCNKSIQLKAEVEYRDKQNEQKEFEITLFPSFIDNKIFILSILKEIATDYEYKEKDALLRSIFGDTFLAMLLLSKDGKILNVNKQFLNKFDLVLPDVKEKNVFQLPILSDECKEKFQRYFNKVFDGNSLTVKQLVFDDNKNKARSFIATLSPLMLKNHNSFDSVLIFMDEITQFQQQEEALKYTSHNLHNYKQALNSAAEVSITDIDGYIIDVNDRFLEQTGYSKEELIGKKHSVLNSRYHSIEFFQNLWTTIKKGKVWRGEIRNITKYGTYYWCDCTIIPITDEKGEIKQFLSVNINITEKKSMITELRNIEHIFKLITENTNDLIVLMNQDGIISYVSSAYERKLGYTKEELIGQFYTKLLSKESKHIWNDELSLLHHTENRKIELIHKARNGSEFWTECNYSVVKDYVQNKGAQIIMVAREISDRKEFENKLLYLAYHDALTQLPNRRYITNEFPNILEKAKKQNMSIAVLYVDGDNFKQVNDKHGHNVGDEFIYQFGKALTKSVRSHDIVARMGGDEFIIILTELAKNLVKREKQLKIIINRLKENLRIGWTIGDHLFTPTASIGVAFYPEHGSTLKELLENSDKALYDIKLSSKDDFKIFDILEE